MKDIYYKNILAYYGFKPRVILRGKSKFYRIVFNSSEDNKFTKLDSTYKAYN